ncbi:TonB-dependent receptor plug domain-containing protein (plasmid) [Acinetobacter soli]|nr:TonB-dependent receptor plug domain-containing protein [Acinetobacter soli]
MRGLGASHTLVLVNGRRQAGTGNRGTSESTDQPNINNIPLAAIERIEILPSTASAIYGSGALGGVINVILRKNYSGNEVNIRYGNNFDGDAGTTSLSLVSGFSLEEGRTNVLFSAQKQDSNAFLRGSQIIQLREEHDYSLIIPVQFMEWPMDVLLHHQQGI